MPLPVFAGDPLVAEKGIPGIWAARKGEPAAWIGPYANDEDAFPSLWNSEISCIALLENHVVAEAGSLPAGVQPPQPRGVFNPVLLRTPPNLREAELGKDVVEVLREAGPQ